MSRILHPLFALLASASRQDLARQLAYLKEEKRILRSRLPAQISVGKLGAQLKGLISIVTYGSFLRWIRNIATRGSTKKISPRKPGRPRTADDIRALIVKLVQENSSV